MICTGSHYDRLPPGYVKIGISRGTPRGMPSGPRIPSLQPGPWFRTAGNEEYRALYAGILADLDPVEIVATIDRLADGRIPVLTCFERFGSGDWCHRAYISAWFALHLGLVVPEYMDPSGAYGAEHSMLPAEYRYRAPALPEVLNLGAK
jgi:hypothetical protein